MHGRAIRIFLVDGTPGGLRTVEVGNWTIKALVVPRAKLASMRGRPEAGRPGVYMLLGADPDHAGRLRVYVGESEDAVGRQDAHAREKDFWDTVLVLVSTDDRLSKGHVRWLEAELLRELAAAKRCSLENGQLPERRPLPEAEAAEMSEFLEQIVLVAEVLGYDVFPVSQWRTRELPTAEAPSGGLATPLAPIFHAHGNDYSAHMLPTDDGFVVQKGSTAVAGVARDSLQTGYKQQRDQLIADGVMSPSGGNALLFTQDYSFRSPSAAIGVVTATNRSGRSSWKLEDGRTLGDWEDSQPGDGVDRG